MIFPLLQKRIEEENSDAGMSYVFLGKGRLGGGTQNLGKCKQQAHLLLCNIAVFWESVTILPKSILS